MDGGLLRTFSWNCNMVFPRASSQKCRVILRPKLFKLNARSRVARGGFPKSTEDGISFLSEAE